MIFLDKRGSRLKDIVSIQDMNFLLMEVFLLVPTLTDNDVYNMDKFLRKKAADLNLIGFELRTKIKSQI